MATVLDAFQTANELADLSGLSSSRFDVTVVGVRRHVKTSLGFTVPVRPAGQRAPDCVVVTAIGFKMPDALQRALGRPDIRDATAVLRQWAEQGATMSAACIGTFVLAESGLLDHHDATTTWWLAPLFRTRYPSVRLDESHMLVKSGRIVTAGAGVESHGSRALADSAAQSETRCRDREILDRRLPAVALRLRPDRSFDPQRSPGRTFRTMAQAPMLFAAPPAIESLEVLGAKLPA